jgi:hypothetical protein
VGGDNARFICLILFNHHQELKFVSFSFPFSEQSNCILCINVSKLLPTQLFCSKRSNNRTHNGVQKILTERLFFITDAILRTIDNPGSDRYVM